MWYEAEQAALSVEGPQGAGAGLRNCSGDPAARLFTLQVEALYTALHDPGSILRRFEGPRLLTDPKSTGDH